ncbi:MAG: sulfide/dihydroorotate dehydrogenase-like FAD/NAD-binding protein [Ignavibacteriales bacterium]|nr:sulfide/dihydroorotate dehydrogenase-like FAD/NAD-binding protein [Ignavibacteriales bacterium]
MFPIIQKERLASTVTKLVIRAPYIAPKRLPGNFVIVRVVESGERIPLTLVDSDPRTGTITLIVQAIGKTTQLLCSLKEGDSLHDVVGPLGTPTPIENHGAVACVGGGVGTAVIYPIARGLREAGNNVYSIIGGRTSELVILEREMAEVSNRVITTTDDGSLGRKGIVTDPLREMLDDTSLGITAVYAIGPLPMMKAVAHLTKQYGVPTFVSLNAIMVDGTGMCGGCRVSIDGVMKFACVDGPEFDAHKVDFDELIMRNRSYGELERLAHQRYLATTTLQEQA